MFAFDTCYEQADTYVLVSAESAYALITGTVVGG